MPKLILNNLFLLNGPFRHIPHPENIRKPLVGSKEKIINKWLVNKYFSNNIQSYNASFRKKYLDVS